MLFRFLRRYFGVLPAALASAGAVVGLVVIPNFSNSAEEYGLPLQAAVLLLLVDIVNHPKSLWRHLALGVVIGLLSSLRLTLVGIGLTAGLYLLVHRLYHQNWRGIFSLLWIAAGIVLVWGVWAALFSAAHALPAFIDQVFRYNLFYWRVSNNQRLSVILMMLDALFHGSAFLTLGLVAWLVVLPFLLLKESVFRDLITSRPFGLIPVLVGLGLALNGLYDDTTQQFFSPHALSFYRLGLISVGLLLGASGAWILTGRSRTMLARWLERYQPGERSGLLLPLCIALVDLPLEIGMTTLPGRDNLFFYLSVLPSLAILTSFLLWSFIPDDPTRKPLTQLCLMVLILAVTITGAVTAYKAATPSPNKEIVKLQAYLRVNAHPGDRILQWSANPQLYFLTGLTPASRYLDLYALFTPGYTSPNHLQTFFNEIRNTRPRYIVYTRFWGHPLLVADDPGQCDQLESEQFLIQLQERDRFRWEDPLAPRPFIPTEMRPVYRWICENYRVSAQVGQVPWFVYELKQANP